MIDIKDDRSERVKYDYPDFPVYIRKGLLSAFPGCTADSHWHDDIELIAVLSGQMDYNVNGQTIHLDEGEGIFINAKQLHYGFSAEHAECCFICILFHPLLLCVTGMFESAYVEPLLGSGVSHFHLRPGIPWQARALRCIRGIYGSRDSCTAPLCIQGQLCLLWNEVIAHTDLAAEKASDAKLTVLKNMISYIHAHYAEKLSLSDIASAGHISKRTCGTLFLAYQNKTPIGYLVDFRIRKSIELMRRTDMTILEISLAVGFSGSSFFAETFRKHMGQSPSQYRRRIREAAHV